LSTLLAVLGWSAFGLAVLVGLALNLVGLFGNWLILLAVALAWVFTGFEHFGPWAIGIMLLLALLGEVLEAGMAGYGAKRFGGGKGSMVAAVVGAIAGAIVGTPWFPVFGTLAGACIGAFLAAAAWEFLHVNREWKESLWTGFGASAGKIAGIAAKFACGIVICIVALLSF